MAELYANCTVSHKMHADRRFDLLAELAGWSRPEACWRMVELWARCTALKTDQPPAEVIRIHLGLRGEQHLVDAVLGERLEDGSVRVLGGGLTGGDTDRFGWYEPIEQRNAAGGRARADQVRKSGRAAGGKFARAGASDVQQPGSRWSSDTSDPPASTSNPPASGFRIPEEDQRSLPRAIPDTVPVAVPPENVPAVSQPIPVQEDIAGTNARPDPATRRAATRGLMAELGEARTRVAAKLGVIAQPLLAFDPGERDLAERIALLPSIPELETFAGQARHAIAMAELETATGEKSLEWFTGAIFADRNLRRLAGKTAQDLARPRAGPNGSAPRAPEPPPRKIKTL